MSPPGAISSATPLCRQISAIGSGGDWSVTKTSIWLRWPMRTGAERVELRRIGNQDYMARIGDDRLRDLTSR